jgi:hypothetical protein
VRTTVTTVSGDYLLPQLPPGEYLISFNQEGFRTIEQRIKVSAAQIVLLDAEMVSAAVSGEITVNARYETVSSTTAAATTFESGFVDKLPMPRTYDATVLLAPGTNIGMDGNISISGGLVSENLFLINGVSAMDNTRGFVHDFYIEDAIDETTIQTSAISSEYGRFAGGIVNMITKAGGNEFHGSYRLSLTNDDWVAKTPVSPSRQDEIGAIHELTIGGPIWKDRIWFFLAGRADPGKEQSSQTARTNIPYSSSYTEDRWEAKATISPHQGHRITASYIDWLTESTFLENNAPSVDLASLDEFRAQEGSLAAIHYAGIITDSFFLEGQYSEKKYAFLSRGREGFTGEMIRGTPWNDLGLSPPAYANMAAWDGDRTTDERNNSDLLLKGSVFLSGKRTGSHEIVFGYDRFDDVRKSNNYQSPTDFVAGSLVPGIIDGQNYFPRVAPGAAVVAWFPIRYVSLGTSFTTDSLFANDTWRVTDRLTLSLGLRYDKNDGQNADGATVADDDRLSPRIGATYDVKGNGRLLLHGGFGRYVAAISNKVANSTASGGGPAEYWYLYFGDPINLGPPPYLSTQQVIEQMFAWFEAQGGTDATHLLFGSPTIPGLTRGIPNGLKSPYTDEMTIGFTMRFGGEGSIRADYVHREAHDFYAQKIDMSTGQVVDEFGTALDFGEIVNDDSLLERTYDGLHTQVAYRISDRLTLGGTWTWSHLRGNWEGEDPYRGPRSSEVLSYPEYKDPVWNAPRGDLFGDRRHKVRAWVLWNALTTRRHNLIVSSLLSYSTGTPYYAAAEIVVGDFVENPGYAHPVTSQIYFFSDRDAYRTDDITSIDLALNYAFNFPAFGTELAVFVQPEVRNLLNSRGAVRHDSTIAVNPAAVFNPWTETPVEGVHFERGANFGEPVMESDYQLPREFRISLGLRF